MPCFEFPPGPSAAPSPPHNPLPNPHPPNNQTLILLPYPGSVRDKAIECPLRLSPATGAYVRRWALPSSLTFAITSRPTAITAKLSVRL